jgi:type VI secretion system protein ImpG
MHESLLGYYDQELRFIRKMVWSFAEKYPEIAGRLLLEPTKCEDPHVERLIEAYAMMAARIQMRLEDDFSEVSDALLGIVYPHILRPIPSSTVVQLALDDKQSVPPAGLDVGRHSLLYTRPVDGVRCRFRTCYPVKLWPIEVTEVELVSAPTTGTLLPAEARSALRIRLKASGSAKLNELELDRLSFFLDAPPGISDGLYRMFAKDAVGALVQCGSDTRPRFLSSDKIRPLGFEEDEALIDYGRESFAGYRLLQEYFAFETKFMFAEVSGLPGASETPYDFIDLSILLTQPIAQITLRPEVEHLKLGCTPASNLFPHVAEPIQITQRAVEYPVVPDARAHASYEVHSIESVTSVRSDSSSITTYAPFYGIHHGMSREREEAFWHSARRPSMLADDAGTDVYLSTVNSNFEPSAPGAEVLTVHLLCTNRDLPAKLPFGDPAGDLEIERKPQVASIRCLRRPTAAIRPPLGPGSRWRLVSHLSLNQLSLSDGPIGEGEADLEPWAGDALLAFQEILKIYDFSDSPGTRQRIAGLSGMRTRRVLRRVGRGASGGFARGLEVELQLDEERFQVSGAFLFASVLERFLGHYTSINSFTQTVARTTKGSEVLCRWPPRAGSQQLL